MKGILVVVVVCLLAEHTTAQITEWTGTGLTPSGANGKIANLTKDDKVSEGIEAGSEILYLNAVPTDLSANVTYAITTNPGDVGEVAGNIVSLAIGKQLDFENSSSIVFVVIATETGQTAADTIGTDTITVNIQNKLEFSKSKFGLCANDGLTAGSVIGTFAVADAAPGETVTYELDEAGPDLEYNATTGVLKVAAGKTLNQATTAGYTLDLYAYGTLTGGTASEYGYAYVYLAVCIPSSGVCIPSSGAVKVSAVIGVIMLSIAASVFI